MNIVLDAPKFIPTGQSTLGEFRELLNKMLESTKSTIQKLKVWQQDAMNSPQEIKSEEKLVQDLLDFKEGLFEFQQHLKKLHWIFFAVFFIKIRQLKRLMRFEIEEINTLITFIKERNADFSPVHGPFNDFESFWKAVNSEDN